nr:hypothetical protein [Sinirhodobacter populi]
MNHASEDLPNMRRGVSYRETRSEILFQEMLSCCATSGEPVEVPASKGERQTISGAPAGDGGSLEQETIATRACTSPKRDQDRQSNRKSGTDFAGRSWPTSSPAQEVDNHRVCDLRQGVHSTQDETGENGNLFGRVQEKTHFDPRQSFDAWLRENRGALSQLPTASGPLIWKPPIEAKAKPEQMEMFG